jgi:methylmalonyl-CoA/ethylmalonyl-CoA epimerase
MRVDHVAIAVNNVDEALKNYQKIFNIDRLEIEVVPGEKVKVVEHGEGIHHIAVTAKDIEKDVARASENGMRILGEVRSGSYGRKVTFIHPKSLNGVLTELCEAQSK